MADKLSSLGEETEQIEFKKSTGELKEGVISIASILNVIKSAAKWNIMETITDLRLDSTATAEMAGGQM